ncbi:HAD-IA family hydrolase [Candidatus Poribacteria bacterium]|nr:HAD-IA family hydrolase [Candidatus Poribacteria bacterium]
MKLSDTMLSQPIQLAMFDMAGTTVNDKVDGHPLMVISMIRAFAKHGIELAPDIINKHRGKQKSEAIQTLLKEAADLSPTDVERVGNSVYRDFLHELENNLSAISEIDGTTELFRHLKSKDIYVGVGSGFPMQVVQTLVSQLGWLDEGLLDYIGSAEQVGVGRPNPKMILDAMERLNITDGSKVLKIGDTVVDIQEGKNAGAWTVAVLTGSQTEPQLMAAGPDYILSSIRELRMLIPR